MVVDYFHVFGTVGAFRPFKTNAALLVNTNAVLPITIAAKRFTVVAGEGGKILQECCRLQNAKASFGLGAVFLRWPWLCYLQFPAIFPEKASTAK